MLAVMPRNYRRKTDRGSTPLEELKSVVAEVKGGKSIRKVSKERKIDRSTLRRYLQKVEDGKTLTAGYKGTSEAKKILREDIEKELADHIKKNFLTGSMASLQRNAVNWHLNWQKGTTFQSPATGQRIDFHVYFLILETWQTIFRFQNCLAG